MVNNYQFPLIKYVQLIKSSLNLYPASEIWCFSVTLNEHNSIFIGKTTSIP